MFEEICLVCGKQLKDDGRAYCSDDCQHLDLSSPSISSSSSALSSPNMGYAVGGDVPALMPSALGSALRKYVSRSGRHVSSSSTSSTSWSITTDEEDEGISNRYRINDFPFHDPSDPLFSDANSKPSSYVYSVNSAALSYARRPSGTNNPPTTPHSHRRLPSGSSSLHVRGIPRSAPILSHADDEEGYSDLGSSGDALDTDDADLHSEQDWEVGVPVKPKYILPSKANRARNRASLPACFSLLKISSPKKDFKPSPVSSSNNTIARASPPTPKVPSGNGLSRILIAPSAPLTSVHTTPRRGRESAKSRSSRRSGRSSPSGSRSQSRRAPVDSGANYVNEEVNLGYWPIASIPARRGREALRRNSSPSPKMLMGVDQGLSFAPRRRTQEGRSQSGGDSLHRTRGRARVEDLGGPGLSSDAPGYGNGRSGLMDRERGIGSHLARVPL
ncbi:hypothetical protein M413DRAFT_21105 [Hebeloma cylindrosporum]|uniref:Uncharacterized protein n=1 Tax=Hebeloma cylindrosporum TaxID=76867 RepID=A0A0C2YGD2_HEBCY|nr:hypothetical protein M413DRAFT_21105 [Hebeloma cylindrosporum h7]